MHRQFCEGRLGANTYVVWNENREPGGRYEAMIIDTGNPVDTIEPFIKKEDLEIKYIVLTHGHYDHVCL